MSLLTKSNCHMFKDTFLDFRKVYINKIHLKYMKLGYPCINNSLYCTSNATFRLRSYSVRNLKEKVSHNLDALKNILSWNVSRGLLFFRIGSGMIPFASHEICKFNWQKYFKKDFKKLGEFIKANNIRISMHPDQFTLINALDEKIVKKSIKELQYHCDILDLMGLDETAKVQIHVGGVYGDKKASIERFVKNYKKLPEKIKKRLCIENDHISYSLKDCLEIHRKTKIPIIFDNLHHEVLNNGESMYKAVKMAKKTWRKKDGVLMIDYSLQKPNARKGNHSNSIDMNKFKKFLEGVKGIDCDIMLEIKDKEKSALKAVKLISN